MFSITELKEQLKKFCKQDGKVVIVHSSLRAIGAVEGGGEALLSLLIEYFTKNDGLLCIPSHTWISMKLDLRNYDSCLGILSSIAASHPLGTRSLHPTHSMVVFGEKNRVEKFIENERFADTPTNPSGCYGNIIAEDGYVLLLGVDHTKNTLIHCIEEMLNVPGRLTTDQIETTIISKSGEEVKRKLFWFDESEIPDVSLHFGKFEPAFRYYDCICDGVLGNAPSQFCSAKKMKEVIELIYKNANGQELLADNLPLEPELYKIKEL
ncbi:MAG: AAC(3) family N-acetyltransferase [Ruminococcaceae bacterium]|nr:AAC(3) family N-acetyltransferase [Oscillospiraceae bacterium]